VIVPTRDRPKGLRRAVESVLAQTVQDLEVIVVDDGSLVPATVPSDSRIRLLRTERNRGPAGARNLGLRTAAGRFVCFLDDDDMWLPSTLDVARQGLARAPIALWLVNDDAPTRILRGDQSDLILDSFVPNVGTVAVRRDICPEFDENLRASEDAEWWLRLAHRGPFFMVERLGLIRYPVVRDAQRVQDRLDGTRRLLSTHREYFAHHKRAASFRWAILGRAAWRLGHRREALVAFAKGLRSPSRRMLLITLDVLLPAGPRRAAAAVQRMVGHVRHAGRPS
jgi:glycosyltransferase involved in cell wall biosynthesis